MFDIVVNAIDFLVVIEGIAVVVLAIMSGPVAITSAQLASMPFKRIIINRLGTFITKCCVYSIVKACTNSYK